jgi:deoxycytidylate deaminase
MNTDAYTFDWSDLAFGSKKQVDALNATFIAAPREFSAARCTEMVKTYLPHGNIILGIAKESYVLGFEDQPQFRMLALRNVIGVGVQKVIDKVNPSSSKHKIYTLNYFQREVKYLYEKLAFKKVLLVNGSWKQAFHTTEEYYALVNHKLPYEMISPFVDEDEAREYEKRVTTELVPLIPRSKKAAMYSETELSSMALQVAKLSFDHTFQTGAVLGKKVKGDTGYTLLTYGYNVVVPYQTYALHHGASREKHFSPPNDLNYYDTNHAEMEILIRAGTEGIELTGTTLFVNLLPCPTCARALSRTGIAQIMYRHDHSNGYAVDLLTRSGTSVKISEV